MAACSKIRTKDDFVKKAIAKHGDLYDYTKTTYTNSKKSISICCLDHGDFTVLPGVHARGYGCPECRLDVGSKDPFLNQMSKIFGAEYDVVDASDLQHVLMNCPEHGRFVRSAAALCRATGCPDADFHSRQWLTKSHELFMEQAKQVHGTSYTYDMTQYSKWNSVITISCPHHGPFRQRAANHLRGHGCPGCRIVDITEARSHDHAWFLDQAKQQYGDTYSYDHANYVRMNLHVTITCKIHGDFHQTPDLFLRGWGCRQCSTRISSLQFSKKACQCLDDIASIDGVYIQHALNGGEVFIPELKQKVDGFAPTTGQVYQFHGDFFHGNPTKYAGDYIHPISKKTMGELYQRTLSQEQRLKDAGYTIDITWENEYDLARFMAKMPEGRRKRNSAAIAADTLVDMKNARR